MWKPRTTPIHTQIPNQHPVPAPNRSTQSSPDRRGIGRVLDETVEQVRLLSAKGGLSLCRHDDTNPSHQGIVVGVVRAKICASWNRTDRGHERGRHPGGCATLIAGGMSCTVGNVVDHIRLQPHVLGQVPKPSGRPGRMLSTTLGSDRRLSDKFEGPRVLPENLSPYSAKAGCSRSRFAGVEGAWVLSGPMRPRLGPNQTLPPPATRGRGRACRGPPPWASHRPTPCSSAPHRR